MFMDTERKNQANKLARECIVTALMLLLKEKPLSAISISELTEKAGVEARRTFIIFQDGYTEAAFKNPPIGFC